MDEKYIQSQSWIRRLLAAAILFLAGPVVAPAQEGEPERGESVKPGSNLLFKSGNVDVHESNSVEWKVDLIDTGQATLTGGRIKRLAPHVEDSTFMLTWGDGVSSVDLDRLLAFHRGHGKLATVTAARPAARFGRLEIEGDRIVEFTEKPQLGEGWINGAFFVLEPGIFEYIEGDATQWEREPLEGLARDGQLMAYKHEGFWQCMDTLRDKVLLEQLWHNGDAPWKTWE